MRFEYSISGVRPVIGEVGGPLPPNETTYIDTDSPGFQFVISWLYGKTKLTPLIVEGYNFGPGADGTPNQALRTGTLVYKSGDQTAYVDVFLTYKHPEETLAILNATFNLGLRPGDFIYTGPMSPIPYDPAKDVSSPFYQTKPVGERYAFSFNGYKLGTEWIDAVGTKWRLIEEGSLGFFKSRWWVKV